MRPAAGSLAAAAGNDALIAISFADLRLMTLGQRESLRASVIGGAALYLRGGAEDARYQLAPLADSAFTVGSTTTATATVCRFTDHAMIPAVLRGEENSFPGAINRVCDVSGDLEPILLARDNADVESPVVFAYRVGNGAIICDVQPDEETSDTPLAWRLADPVQRCINISGSGGGAKNVEPGGVQPHHR
jgi:hypothetical protein